MMRPTLDVTTDSHGAAEGRLWMTHKRDDAGYDALVSLPWSRRTEQVHVALAGVLACALVVVLPLTGSAFTASELAAVSLVVLALASALSTPQLVTQPPRLDIGLSVAGEAGPPVLRTRNTDPTHHPLAPRAPGLA
jgi:hypothetical protein